MPRARNTRSIAIAASASSCGMTRSRLETRVTSHAHRQVGAGELGAGDAGADHDQVLGQLGQVVDLAPGRGCARRRARRSGSTRGVAPVAISTVRGVDRVLGVAVGRGDHDPVGVAERVLAEPGACP